VDFIGCISSGYSPRLYHVNFHYTIAHKVVLVITIP